MLPVVSCLFTLASSHVEKHATTVMVRFNSFKMMSYSSLYFPESNMFPWIKVQTCEHSHTVKVNMPQYKRAWYSVMLSASFDYIWIIIQVGRKKTHSTLFLLARFSVAWVIKLSWVITDEWYKVRNYTWGEKSEAGMWERLFFQNCSNSLVKDM